MEKLSPGLLKFDDIRNEIKENFTATNKYSFLEGSNFSTFNDVLAYHDMLTNYSVANLANELFLPTCSLRNSAVKIANKMNYYPRRKIPAKVIGTIRFLGANVNNTNFTIDEFVFQGQKTGYSFSAKNVTFLKKGSFFEAEFVAEEKSLSIFTYIPTSNPNQTFTIENDSISNDRVVVYTYAGVTLTTYESMHDYSFVPSDTTPIYYLSENEDIEFCPKFTFGDNIIGKIPNNTEIMYVNYYETHGVNGNGETKLTIVDVKSPSTFVNGITSIANYSITVNSVSFGGKDSETLEEMKVNIPGFYSAKQRGVTKNDYLSLLSNQPGVQFIDVIGSENIKKDSLLPMGKIFISVVPSDLRDATIVNTSQSFPMNSVAHLSLNEYNVHGTMISLIGSVKDKTVLATSVSLVSPSYLYVNIQPFIEIKNAYQDFNVVAREVFQTLSTFANDFLFGTGKKFREDNFIEEIDVLDSILSSRIETSLSLLINEKSITDNYYMTLPKNLLKTNYEQYKEDVVFNKYNYIYSEMPLERRTIYCDIANTNATGFKRYIANDNFSSKTALQILSKINIDRETENKLSFDTSESYSSKIIGSEKTLNTLIYSFDDLVNLGVAIPDGVLDFGVATSGSVPDVIEITAGVYEVLSGTYYTSKPSANCWFAYIKEKSTLYLTIIYYIDSDMQAHAVCVDKSSALNQLRTIGLIPKTGVLKNNYFYFSIEETFNLSNKNYSGFEIVTRYNTSTESKETSSESIKLFSKCKIGDLYFDESLIIRNKRLNQNFSAEVDGLELIVRFGSGSSGTDLLVIARDNTSGMEISKTSNFPLGTDFKNGKFEIKKIDDNLYELYAFEAIDGCSIGYFDRVNSIINFYENVSYVKDVNSGETVFESLTHLLQSRSVFAQNVINEVKLIQKNTYNEGGDVVGNKSDFDAEFGVCIIPNVNMPRKKII